MESLRLTVEDLDLGNNKIYKNNPNDTYMINHYELGIVPRDGKYKCLKPFRLRLNNHTERIFNVGEVCVVDNNKKMIMVTVTYNFNGVGVEEYDYPSDITPKYFFKGWFDCFVPVK
jgi:hypothetical protein